MDIVGWLIGCGVGIIFGIFPLWWWCSASVIIAEVRDGKHVAKWLVMLSRNNPLSFLLYSGIHNKRFYPYLLRGLAIIWIIGSLLLALYKAISNYSIGDIGLVIEVTTSFPLFILLTVKIPSFFLKRYLHNLKTSIS